MQKVIVTFWSKKVNDQECCGSYYIDPYNNFHITPGHSLHEKSKIKKYEIN